MIALDTNVVVRLITQDDPDQFARAAALVERDLCFVPDTVLLETAWVLKGLPGATRERVHSALTGLLGLPNIRISAPDRLANALAWYAGGMDFADAMHLAASQHVDAFVSFDRHLVRTASGKGVVPVSEPTGQDSVG